MSDQTMRRYRIEHLEDGQQIMFGNMPVAFFLSGQDEEVDKVLFELNSLYGRVKELGDQIQHLKGGA